MHDSTENIRARILLPIVVVGFILIVSSLLGGYWLQKKAIDNSVDERISGVNRLFKEILREESKLMDGQIDFIQKEKSFYDLFQSRRRIDLAEESFPLFERMRSRYRITHFYFHEKDQVCFLRVHSPDRYGDYIDRFTMKGAASTGSPFYGIELGPLGTFTLRTVHPWIVDGKLDGYIELGMEIEHITKLIKESLKLDLLVLIEKKFLKREGWENGLKILNRTGNWELFNDFVIIDSTIETTSTLNETLRRHQKNRGSLFSVKIGDIYYKGKVNHLVDAGNRHIGEVISMVDVTAQHRNLWFLILMITLVSSIAGGVLIQFFNRYIGDIQSRLIRSKEELLFEIKHRRQSEKALEESEKRFRSLFEESKDAILSTNTEGYLQLINPAGLELFGLDGDALESIRLQDLYVDESIARKFSSAISEKGYVRNFGLQMKDKNGEVMDCLMTVTAKIVDGTLTGYEGIIRDFTPFKKMELKLRRLSTTDSLTGINNRRYFRELANKEIKRSFRFGHSFALVMLDIDHFKKINDTYGHSVGDKVLREFCSLCLKEIRENDIMGRLGGEEFAIALLESDSNTAAIISERIRKTISSHIINVNNENIQFTVSLGITELCPDDNLDSVLERADNALYEAKRSGRNQIRISSPED